MHHPSATKAAFAALSECDRDVWREHEAAIIADYCEWPDRYFEPADYPQIAPYQLEIDGIPFHYSPPSQVQYAWQMVETETGVHPQPVPEPPNKNWQFMRDGFTYYLTAITEDLSAGRTADAAKRLGILLHVFQDTHELHALEGPWGTDFFALDNLLEWPQGDRYLSPTMLILGRGSTQTQLEDYHPRLEGTSIGEAVLRLFSRYVSAALSNRALQVPIVQARLRGEEAAAAECFRRIDETVQQLSADVIHTVTALAKSTFDDAEMETLRQFPLDPKWAVQRPGFARGNYTFTPIVPNACLDSHRHCHPLRLKKDDGSIQQWDRGWGSGAHFLMVLAYEFPTNVYRRLSAQIGLHESLGAGGCVDLQILHQGKIVIEQRLQDSSPTINIDLPIEDGGEVRFILQEVPGSYAGCNNVVWGDPMLCKS